jgi:V8-like Glu-specific endopeptidase
MRFSASLAGPNCAFVIPSDIVVAACHCSDTPGSENLQQKGVFNASVNNRSTRDPAVNGIKHAATTMSEGMTMAEQQKTGDWQERYRNAILGVFGRSQPRPTPDGHIPRR